VYNKIANVKMAVVWQCKLVSGWGLRKRRLLLLMGLLLVKDCTFIYILLEWVSEHAVRAYTTSDSAAS